MIGVIWSVITANPIARLLAKIAGTSLGAVVTTGMAASAGRKGRRQRATAAHLTPP